MGPETPVFFFRSHADKAENTSTMFDATAREFLLNDDNEDNKFLMTLGTQSMAISSKFNDGSSFIQNLDDIIKIVLEICALV